MRKYAKGLLFKANFAGFFAPPKDVVEPTNGVETPLYKDQRCFCVAGVGSNEVGPFQGHTRHLICPKMGRFWPFLSRLEPGLATCDTHPLGRAWPPLLSLTNSIVFGVNGSLREAFGGVGWSFGTNFGGRGGDGGADPVNIIASCKASVAAACAAVSPVNGTGKGTGPTTSSPSVSWPAPGASTSVRLTCGKSAMAVVKRNGKWHVLNIRDIQPDVNITTPHGMHKSQLQ